MMDKIKSGVLDDIMSWADQVSLDRIKARKQPQVASQESPLMEQPEQPPAESPPDENDGMSMEDMMNLAREYEGGQ
jgi:hypothetical protein